MLTGRTFTNTCEACIRKRCGWFCGEICWFDKFLVALMFCVDVVGLGDYIGFHRSMS
jgi:hypothetical protein